jgi:predicted RNA binding protein YcfA (HicA-like mRNA interferase family)
VNNKNKQTLKEIYTDPIPADIKWNDIEKLIENIGGTVSQGKGSRVRFKIGELKAVFHRPHPEPDTNKLTVRDIREFLENAGVKPEQ